MDGFRGILSSLSSSDQTAVERAIAEIRAGRPVLLRADEGLALAIPAEVLDGEMASRLDSLANGAARLALPAARLKRLGIERAGAGAFALPVMDEDRIAELALRVGARADAPVHGPDPLDEAALDLARLALLLPAAIVVPVPPEAAEGSGLLSVTIAAIAGYRAARRAAVRLVSRAPVPLAGARDAEFAVFRGGEGMRDHVAIVVGRPKLDEPVAVRLHSACLTGDLFGSLKCDCGDQLRETVHWMAAGDGGIVLYLDQEGRGNGIANKMRAYRLQCEGFDTYEADEILGFDLDQRRYDFAAEMLKQLGVTRVRIVTNNPQKIGALRAAGLEVVSERRMLGRLTPQNVRYLAAKRDRAGHYIDLDQAVATSAGE